MQLGRVLGKQAARFVYKPSSALLDSSILLGVEVEVENVKPSLTSVLDTQDPASGYWQQVTDDSLRNNGAEFVFATPLFGEDAVTAIRYLCNHALKSKWKTSSRTGIHVHMDVRTMEAEKFRSMCVLYALTEKLLYRWVGDHREFNIFCMPWYMADGEIFRLASFFGPKYSKERSPDLLHHLVHMGRYGGLNLASLAKYGSVEFRHLKTTFDQERLLKWINIILSLRVAAEGWKNAPEDLIQEMYTLGPRQFVDRIYGTLSSELWYPEFVKDMYEDGVAVAKEFVELSGNSTDKLTSTFNMHVSIMKDEAGDHPATSVFINNVAKLAKAVTVQPFAVPANSYIYVSGAIRRLWTEMQGPASSTELGVKNTTIGGFEFKHTGTGIIWTNMGPVSPGHSVQDTRKMYWFTSRDAYNAWAKMATELHLSTSGHPIPADPAHYLTYLPVPSNPVNTNVPPTTSHTPSANYTWVTSDSGSLGIILDEELT